MIKLITNFLLFLKVGSVKELNKKLSFNFFFKLFLLKFIILFIYVVIIRIIFGNEFIPIADNKTHKSLFITFLNFVVLAPILEELIFRNHLNLSFKSLIISLLVTIFLFYGDWFILIMVFYFLIIWILNNSLYQKKFLLFIYLSSLLFSIAHVIQTLNLPETIGGYLFPLFPHFFSGLLLAYIYFRNGIFASMFFHGLWNLLPFVIEWLKR